MKLLLLLLLASASVAAAGGLQVAASDDLRLLFDTDDELELGLAALSLRQDTVTAVAEGQRVPVLACVRKLVEQRRGGLAGTSFAADILSQLPHGDAASLWQRCEDYHHSQPQVRVDRNEQALHVSHLHDYARGVRTLLYRFIKPTTTCHGLSARLGAGLVAAFGGDIALEYCYANNGRHWLQTALEAEVGYGAGVLSLWRFGSYRYRMNYLGGPFTYTKTRHRDWALGFGLSRAEFGEEYAHGQRGIIIVIPHRRGRGVSAGIGAAYLRTWGRRGGLKFFPLGTRDKRLLAEYMALTQHDSQRGEDYRALGERAVLQVEHSMRGDTEMVRFRLCVLATSVCEELLGGRYFASAVLAANFERLQHAQAVLTENSAGQRTLMITAASLALATSAPVTLKNAAGKFSRTAKILPSRWDGYDFNDLVNEGRRGFRNVRSATFQKLWQPLQEILQQLFDSRPVQVVGETASKTVEAWNGLFVKLGRERVLSRALRTGIPAVVIVGGGIITLQVSLKLARQELTLEKFNALGAQQEEILQLVHNPYQEVLIADRTLLVQSLRYLVSLP